MDFVRIYIDTSAMMERHWWRLTIDYLLDRFDMSIGEYAEDIAVANAQTHVGVVSIC